MVVVYGLHLYSVRVCRRFISCFDNVRLFFCVATDVHFNAELCNVYCYYCTFEGLTTTIGQVHFFPKIIFLLFRIRHCIVVNAVHNALCPIVSITCNEN